MTTVKQAVILAGGMGTRLRPLTDTLPKPMIQLNHRPFLEYLIEMLKGNGISEVVLLLGYLPDKVMEYFKDGSKFGLSIKYSVGTVEDETGTRIRNAAHLLDSHFLLMYCDNFLPINLADLVAFHDAHQATATVTVYTNKDHSTKNNMIIDENGFVVTYDRTRKTPGLTGVDVGFFILPKTILSRMPQTNFSFEDVILPALIAEHQLAGYLTDHKYYSVGSLERLPITEQYLKPKKVVFLDRDGVINKKPPKAEYVKKWSEFEFLPGAVDALALLTKHGYQVFLITNQAGIARGAMTEADLADIHTKMIAELGRHGASIAGIYHCPHGWNENCECRKPKPGMLFQAAREHTLDLTKTVFIGDDERDEQAGRKAGCRTLLVTPERPLLDLVTEMIEADDQRR